MIECTHDDYDTDVGTRSLLDPDSGNAECRSCGARFVPESAMQALVAEATRAAAELRHAWKGSVPEWSNEACNWRRFDANLVSKAIRILEEAVTKCGKC